jgi:hypothetical protein
MLLGLAALYAIRHFEYGSGLRKSFGCFVYRQYMPPIAQK